MVDLFVLLFLMVQINFLFACKTLGRCEWAGLGTDIKGLKERGSRSGVVVLINSAGKKK